MKTRILIVDDEAPARSRLAAMLADLDEYTVVGEAENGSDALQQTQREAPDIVLLDIRMPDMDGIETARHLSGFDEPPGIIFTTAFDSYAIEAFDAHAIGYLLKPVRQEKLARALMHATRLARPQLAALSKTGNQSQERNNICARRGASLQLIPIEDIYFFQADQKYVTVRHAQGEDLIDEPLKELADEFARYFIRIHRSALVALAHVDRMEKTNDGQYVVWMRNCAESLPVSRRHVTAVKACVKQRV